MPSEETHIRQSFHNQKMLKHIQIAGDQFCDWAVVVTFYRAVHIVEAILANHSSGEFHCCSHEERHHLLKRPPYQEIWKQYRPIMAASMIARYLQAPRGGVYEKFSDYMPPEQVKSELLYRRMSRLETLAGKYLSKEGYALLTGKGKAGK